MTRNLVLTCMKNEGIWLLEWVAWNLSIGFDHILAYTNDCEDGTDLMFERLAELGYASHRDNTRQPGDGKSYQVRAFRNARREPLLADFEYTAILDADEFLNIKVGDGTIDALISATTKVQGQTPDVISLPWKLFGAGGKVAFEPGFVTENLTRAASEKAHRPSQAWAMKSLFRTEAFDVFGVHRPRQPVGNDWSKVLWVNAGGTRMPERFHALSKGNWRFARDSISYEFGQVNHYAVKYAQSFLMKSLRGAPHGGMERGVHYWEIMNRNETEDRSIIERLERAREIHRQLLADPVLRQLDETARSWYLSKIDETLSRPDFAAMFAAITHAPGKAAAPASAAPPKRSEWENVITQIGTEGGFFRELGKQHSALHVRTGDTLVVTFDNLDHVLERTEDRLPWGFEFVRSHGWSILGLMAHGWTWYRDPDVYDFFDKLRDEGFFKQFSRVIFYGASMGGYAAAAFSAAAPGATVITISPQATLDRTLVPWETRYTKAWGRDFSDRYGYAPDSLRTAENAYLLFDPLAELDAQHAALFEGDHITRLHCRMMGHRIASAMQAMNVLKPVIESAIDGSLTPQDFYSALRRRRTYARYLKEMLARLERRGNPWLMSLFCQHYLATRRGPMFRKNLNAANAELARQGREAPGGT